MVGNQRSRLLAAVARAVAEHGYASLSVQNVIDAAGVSRSTFYEHFSDRRNAVIIAQGEVFDRLSSVLRRACGSEFDWPHRLAAAVRAAIGFAVKAPEEARLLLFETVGADRELAAQALACNDQLVGMLRGGREHSPESAAMPELTERALVGAATSIVGNRLMQGKEDELRRLEPDLVELMLVPYVGGEEARRIATAA